MKWRCYICGEITQRNDTVGEVVLCNDKECHKAAWRRVRLGAERLIKKSDGKSES